MKIIYRYLFREHLGPFFFGLSIIMFIFLMQFLVKYVGQIFGKGIPLWTIAQLIVLNLAWMLALAVPMATLLAVLMAYGRFSADNEITILKSSGISIFKLIRPSLLFGLILTLVMLYFNDHILPDANHMASQKMRAIREKKPTLALEENIFYPFPPYSFVTRHIEKSTAGEWLAAESLLGPEYKRDTQPDRLKDITIFDRSDPNKTITINADYGYMVYSPERKALVFTLFNGEYHSIEIKKPDAYQRSQFERNVVIIPARNFELEERESNYRSDREMNIAQMEERVREARQKIKKQNEKVARDIAQEWKEIEKRLLLLTADSSASYLSTTASVEKFRWRLARQKAMRVLDRFAQKMKSNMMFIRNQEKVISKYEVEIQKKLSIPFASLVFIIVGVPLGIMARKGSLGVAFSLSLGFFVLYWAFLIGGEKLADRQFVSSFWAMWAANAITFVFGLFLVWRAVRESSFIPWERMRLFFRPGKRNKKGSPR